MKKLKRKVKSYTNSNNRVVLAAVAGAITGLAITYLLESERGRNLLSSLSSSIKTMTGNIKLPELNVLKS